ncbi:hypothetical protein BTIS_1263 [Bifidobacterium tissieri]|uniref:Uncharacterized protein n=1 Tax=Bifidobacterium tissieri TaxID=1630162 RepID=A0A261FEK7_9BIFI|nr:hypothetical protein BTIS_1263 [Bifidobacterium tissieri]
MKIGKKITEEDFTRFLKSFESNLDKDETPTTFGFIESVCQRLSTVDPDGNPTFTMETLSAEVIQALYHIEIRLNYLEREKNARKSE